MINVERIVERIDQLAECSQTGPGVTRLSFTEESEQADHLLIEWMQQAGMIVKKDAMNNIIGRYEGRDKQAPVLLIGSHSDSVINGGKYDGALGIIAAIEVIQVLHDQAQIPEHPIEVVSFCDEEGARFHTTFLGSKAMAGTLTNNDLDLIDDRGISVREAMRNSGLIPECFQMAKRDPQEILAYLEMHIEQGVILEQLNQPCCAVAGIAGASRYTFTVKGVAGHAGTVSMHNRRDALAGTAEILLIIEELAKQYDPLVATVGKLTVLPGASNVIPESVTGTLDIRAMEQRQIAVYIESLYELMVDICSKRSLSFQLKKIIEADPVSCSDSIIMTIENVLIQNGIEPKRLISGAGHDAMVMAQITNIGMIFVRCAKGISHSPEEFVSKADIEISAQVLLETIWKLANNE